MKTRASTLAFTAALAAGLFCAGPILAAAKDDAATKKAKKEAELLARYDKNSNGKLDPDEEAAMKADQAKAKAEREKKKKEAQSK